MRRTLLLIFGLVMGFGAVILLLGGFGDMTVIASTGGIYGVLEARGLAEDRELLGALYEVVVRLRWPWTAVQGAGVAVLVAGAIGFSVTWRRLR